MNSLTSLFSSDMNLNSDVPVQTGGAKAMSIILSLVFVCCIFCIAVLGVNGWNTTFVFTNGPTVGLMSFMMFIMSALIMYLAFTSKDTLSTAETQILPPGYSIPNWGWGAKPAGPGI